MIKRVILLTSSFPYGNGEQFLETEIEYLSSEFEKITIIPMSIYGNRRKIPKNVYVDKSFVIEKKSFIEKKIFRIMMVIKSRLFYKELFLNWDRLVNKYNINLMVSELSTALFLSKYIHKYVDEYSIFYSYWNGTTSLALIALTQEFNIQTLSRVHKGELYEELHPYNYLPFRAIIYNNLSQIHSISNDGIKYIQDKYTYDKKNIFLSRLGVKKQNFITKISEKNKFTIISCSNFVEEKRFELVIKVIKHWAKKSKLDITWFHIGNGDGLEYYKNKAFKESIKNLTINFLGYLENREVIDFYKNNKIDVFINLSSSEGIPVSIMEAQSCSIPVIATDVGGVSEIVNSDNGYLLDKDFDIDIVNEYLNEISKNNELLREKKKKSYETWNNNYNAEKNYKNFISTMRI